MYQKHDTELGKTMFGKEWTYDDSVWTERKFKRIIRDISKTAFVVDSETQEVRLMYKITLFKDLTQEQLRYIQFTLNYVYRDWKFHATIKCNHAQTGEVMKAIGYGSGWNRVTILKPMQCTNESTQNVYRNTLQQECNSTT